MFSYEERIKAVKLLFQYDKSYATVIRELGYPSRRALTNWNEEYVKNGSIHMNLSRDPSILMKIDEKLLITS